MAQLKDTKIDGNLEVSGNIILQNANCGIDGIHSDTGETSSMIRMSQYGNTVIGYHGYVNQNGNSHIYGNDVLHYIASAGNTYFRPYFRAGDVLKFNTNDTCFRGVGYVTNAGKNIVFTIPVSKPIIGSPSAQITESDGLILRQNNNYTHGSTSSEYAKPTSYSVFVNPNVGFTVTAYFDVSTDVINNSPIGIYWSGTITLS